MRYLILFRGAPGCGKSTFIKENGLEQYSLSADNIRLLCQSPLLNINGGYSISQKNDKKVWQLLFDVLEQRMLRGEFIVVDATNSKTEEMTRYKNIAETYRYRIICVDMTDIPKDVCKDRNNKRLPEYKRVPDYVIDNMYSRFETQKIPSGIKAIKPSDFWETVSFNPIDLSKYNKIHHIGDIHGCNTVLQNYLKDGLKDNELYIFLGDYIDRGIENVDVLNFLFTVMEKPNVILLTGNHEGSLWNYGNEMPSKSKEFENFTKVQLNKKQIDKKKIRILYRKLRQIAYYKYDDKYVVVTHGGISTMPERLEFLATEQLIRGVGEYEDMEFINENFIKTTPNNYYQIHGHRNIGGTPVQVNERCFNLEGEVEFGGHLRVVTLDKVGFNTYEVQNGVFEIVKEEKPQEVSLTNQEIVNELRKNKFIKETKFNNISSFNFTNEAFRKGVWNEQTIRARGLFFNTNTGDIVIRSFNKFFNINEKESTKIGNLKYTLEFPVTAYVKYNGFLGLIGYDKETDNIIITSKSNMNSPFSKYFENIYDKKVIFKDKIKDYLKENNCTLVFEVIDPMNDPHMIEYKEENIVLLNIINNNINYSQKNYEELVDFARTYQLDYKEQAVVLTNWDEFYDWYTEVTEDDYKYNNQYIEGFVIEDSSGFMTKIKGKYYCFWKFMRAVKDEVGRQGYFSRTSGLTTPLANKFYGWLRTQTKEALRKDIITLRNQFYNEI